MNTLSRKNLEKLQSILKRHHVIVTNEEVEQIGIRLLELTLLAKEHRLREIYKDK